MRKIQFVSSFFPNNKQAKSYKNKIGLLESRGWMDRVIGIKTFRYRFFGKVFSLLATLILFWVARKMADTKNRMLTSIHPSTEEEEEDVNIICSGVSTICGSTKKKKKTFFYFFLAD
jgi:hypothetical protein